MKILKKLYYGNVSEISRKTKTRDIEKEKREDFLYDTLKKPYIYHRTLNYLKSLSI